MDDNIYTTVPGLSRSEIKARDQKLAWTVWGARKKYQMVPKVYVILPKT